VVYPKDNEKPPLGQGLNRKAQVTLDRIYPTNKQTRAPIKDVDTIIKMDYDATLRKACYKMKARFVEYIPDTGSWVFKVDHFSKYGLPDDSDDDEEMVVAESSKSRPPPAQVPVAPKPPVITPAQQPQVPAKPHTLSDAHATFNTSISFSNIETMDEGST
jgi:nuclear pore complex protein Nup98-Nup96